MYEKRFLHSRSQWPWPWSSDLKFAPLLTFVQRYFSIKSKSFYCFSVSRKSAALDGTDGRTDGLDR